MLDPNERKLYIDALRPPYGFSLDRAIGTTYSLNLLTLLAVPLSFAKFELKEKDEILKDPISILEAVRRSAGKFHVFCQTGGIHVPKIMNPLFNYLEKTIIEVNAPHPEGTFHPKVWVLRFVDKSGKSVLYRFLCLSRNITFDRSWDTILTIEGEVKKRFFSKNKPLSEFINALPGLSKNRLPRSFYRKIEEIAEEIRHVDFEPPSQFEDFKFWPLGLSGNRKFPIIDDYWSLLVVSPFLTDGLLQRVALTKSKNILVSRVEELDILMPETREKHNEIYYMDEAAGDEEESSIETSSDSSQKSDLDKESDLSGLHAKLFIAETGWDAHVWTGSANATSNAFKMNVEFLVELVGKRSRVGIKKFMGEKEGNNDKKKGNTTFRDLLFEYKPPEPPVKEDEKKKKLERKLEAITKQIANTNFRVLVISDIKKKTYTLQLDAQGIKGMKSVEDVKCRVWPISLSSYRSSLFDLSNPKLPVLFSDLPFDKLTSLFAFELKVKDLAKSFVLNLPIKGLPPDREEKMLQAMISSQDKFLHYLLLLLFEGESAFLAALMETKLKGLQSKGRQWLFGEDMPLFEELVRAYSRYPEKIERIAELVDDLSKTEKGKKVLPEEFQRLWAAFQKGKRK